MRSLLLLAAMPFLALCAQAAEPRNPVDIREWEVPYGGHPRDPAVRDAEDVWFVGQRGHYVARLAPKSGAFRRYDLPDNAGPHNVIVGSDGIAWYAGNLKGYIGRIDPGTGAVEKIPMPDGAARDPHTLIFDRGEKNIWFTVQGSNFVGRMRLSDRKMDLIPVPTSRARPYGITIAPDGTPWVALFGTNKLASLDPETLALSEHALPEGSRPRRLVAATDGRIYYVDYRRGYLGRLDPKNGKIKEWAMPSGGGARPYGMTIDHRDRVWFVESGASPNNFVGFDTAAEAFVSITPIPSGGGSVRHMDFHAATRTVWFGTDAGTIGRALVGE